MTFRLRLARGIAISIGILLWSTRMRTFRICIIGTGIERACSAGIVLTETP